MTMRPPRDLVVVIALFALLIAFTVFGALRRAEQDQAAQAPVSYSTHSELSDGTLALQEWLEAMGYQSRAIEGSTFSWPADARVLFVFPPREPYTDQEAQLVLRWVERGNTLIVAQELEQSNDDRLMRALKARLLPVGFAGDASPQQPLNGVALSDSVHTETAWGLDLARDDFVQYLGSGDKPLLVSWAQGRGTVFLTSAPFLFTNASLRNEANAALVLALLAGVPRGSVVMLDEFHLLTRATGDGCDQSLQSLVYCTPWGWSVIFALAVVFAFLAVNGRRFGRVMPLPQEIARRSPAEYVLSTAQLFQRAGKRQMVLGHYHRQLKRSLGQPYRIRPDLPDDEFVNELSRYRDIDRSAVLRVLHALSQPAASERSLVKLADEAVQLTRRAGS